MDLRRAARELASVRLFLAVVALLAAQLIQPTGAFACSGGRLIDASSPGYDARIMFVGTAVRREDEAFGPMVSTGDPILWTFVVDSVERGQVGNRVTIASPRGSETCGIDFTLGHRYRVTGWGDGHAPPEAIHGDAVELEQLPNPPSVEGEFRIFPRYLIVVGGVLVLCLAAFLLLRVRGNRTMKVA
jgi:hypothetical protein